MTARCNEKTCMGNDENVEPKRRIKEGVEDN